MEGPVESVARPNESLPAAVRAGRAFRTLAVLGLIAASLLIASARWFTYGELASHFSYTLGLAAFAGAVVFALARSWRVAALGVFAGAYYAGPELSLSLAPPAKDGELTAPSRGTEGAAPEELLMVVSNVLRPNERYAEVFEAVRLGDPDLIGLLEISKVWHEEALAALKPDYPYVAKAIDTPDWSAESWGLLLFSKRPLSNLVATPITVDGIPARPILGAEVELDGEPLAIHLAHPQRPGAKWRMEMRVVQLEKLRQLGAGERERVIIGDLNMTSTSPLFSDLLEASGLRDSRAGFGRLPTWHLGTRIPGPIPVRLPRFLSPWLAIDHALVSGGLAVKDRGTREIPGSDHRAITLRISRH